MTAKKKIAQKRLILLQVAERLRNISEAESSRYDYPPCRAECKACPDDFPPYLRSAGRQDHLIRIFKRSLNEEVQNTLAG